MQASLSSIEFCTTSWNIWACVPPRCWRQSFRLERITADQLRHPLKCPLRHPPTTPQRCPLRCPLRRPLRCPPPPLPSDDHPCQVAQPQPKSQHFVLTVCLSGSALESLVSLSARGSQELSFTLPTVFVSLLSALSHPLPPKQLQFSGDNRNSGSESVHHHVMLLQPVASACHFVPWISTNTQHTFNHENGQTSAVLGVHLHWMLRVFSGSLFSPAALCNWVRNSHQNLEKIADVLRSLCWPLSLWTMEFGSHTTDTTSTHSPLSGKSSSCAACGCLRGIWGVLC